MGEPLQLVTLNADDNTVEINDEALAKLGQRLEGVDCEKVAIVAVMGAFRTGKSFLLDLCLRYLRYQDETGLQDCMAPDPPPRESDEDYPLPPWLTCSGNHLEGGSRDAASGFRFKGGMDACTEGIWLWSEPFLRVVNGERVALLLMDTQGAWESDMTPAQSATIFGLTAVLSSKLIYNVNMQIQEDKIENLAFFMNFAQAALRKAASEEHKISNPSIREEIEQPFQALDFLVRDWKNYRDLSSMVDCESMASEHLNRHVNPDKKGTAESLRRMFKSIHCTCFPHPGFKIEKEAWTGNVQEIDRDFVRFADKYMHSVFSSLDTKKILGQGISTGTFPDIFRSFVDAFQNAAPAAVKFTEAISTATCLLGKERATKTYRNSMDKILQQHAEGLEEVELMQEHLKIIVNVKDNFQSSTIFGGQATLDETWKQIEDDLLKEKHKYVEDNQRKMEKALAKFAPEALLAICAFLIDLASDYLFDWWSPSWVQISRVLFQGYCMVLAYICFHAWKLFQHRGRIPMFMAAGELLKESMRLVAIYGRIAQDSGASLGSDSPSQETKKDK